MASNPDMQTIKSWRDLSDTFHFKNVFYAFLPGIRVAKLIRVQKLDETLSLNKCLGTVPF